MEFKLHPLVLLNCSDHHMRCAPKDVLRSLVATGSLFLRVRCSLSYKAQLNGQEPPRVMGCLLGIHLDSRTVEVCNSFEIKYDGVADDVPQIDSAFLTQKQDQCERCLVFTRLSQCLLSFSD
jgi:COP9 signalosome complex subunit 6